MAGRGDATREDDQLQTATKLHVAKTYAQAAGGDPAIDYCVPIIDKSLTGSVEEVPVPMASVEDTEETLEERAAKYMEMYPHWFQEMAITAARLDFEKRPCEKGKWEVYNNRKELKKATRALKLAAARKERRNK